MNIINQNVVKITFERFKNFYKPVLILLLVGFTNWFIFFIVFGVMDGTVEITPSDEPLGWAVLMLFMVISLVNGLLFAKDLPKFIRRGIPRKDYFLGSLIAALDATLIVSIIVIGLNGFLVATLPHLILNSNPLTLDVSWPVMILTYILGGVVSYLIGFCLVVGWLKTEISIRWLIIPFLAWQFAIIFGLLQGRFLWLGRFMMSLIESEPSAMTITSLLILVLIPIAYLLVKSIHVKVK